MGFLPPHNKGMDWRTLACCLSLFSLAACKPEADSSGSLPDTNSAAAREESGVYLSASGGSLELKSNGRYRFTIGKSSSEGTWDRLGSSLTLNHETINGESWATIATEIANGKRSPEEGLTGTYVQATVDPSGKIRFPETKDAYGDTVPNSELVLSKN